MMCGTVLRKVWDQRFDILGTVHSTVNLCNAPFPYVGRKTADAHTRVTSTLQFKRSHP